MAASPNECASVRIKFMYKYRLQKRGAFGFSRISGFCLCFVARLGGSTLQSGAAAGGRRLLWSLGALSPGCSGGSAGTDCLCPTIEPGHSNADKTPLHPAWPGSESLPERGCCSGPAGSQELRVAPHQLPQGSCGFLLLSPFLQYELFSTPKCRFASCHEPLLPLT